MKIPLQSICLIGLVAAPVHAADFGYTPEAYPSYEAQVVVERPVALRRQIVVRRSQAPVRVVEQRTVQGPEGAVRTIRIYERYGSSMNTPRPPREIPFVSPQYGAVRSVSVAPLYGVGQIVDPLIVGLGDDDFD